MLGEPDAALVHARLAALIAGEAQRFGVPSLPLLFAVGVRVHVGFHVRVCMYIYIYVLYTL